LLEKLGLFKFESKTVYDKTGDLGKEDQLIKIVFNKFFSDPCTSLGGMYSSCSALFEMCETHRYFTVEICIL